MTGVYGWTTSMIRVSITYARPALYAVSMSSLFQTFPNSARSSSTRAFVIFDRRRRLYGIPKFAIVGQNSRVATSLFFSVSAKGPRRYCEPL